MAPWYLVPMVQKKRGCESTPQNMPPPQKIKRIKWLYPASWKLKNGKPWVVWWMLWWANCFLSGEFLGSSKWLQLAVGVQHDRHLHQIIMLRTQWWTPTTRTCPRFRNLELSEHESASSFLTGLFTVSTLKEVETCSFESCLLMTEIWHQLTNSFSASFYLQGFVHPRWCKTRSDIWSMEIFWEGEVPKLLLETLVHSWPVIISLKPLHLRSW